MNQHFTYRQFITILSALLLVSLGFLSCKNGAQIGTDDLMVFDRQVVRLPNGDTDTIEHILYPGDSLSLKLSLSDIHSPVTRRLRVVGGSVLPIPYNRRSESNFRNFCYHIDDCLDSLDTFNEPYSLYYKGNNEKWERNAYFRVSGSQLNPGRKAGVILPVKADRVIYQSQKGLFLEIQMYLKKPGRHPDDIYDKADSILIIPVPQGDYPWKTVTEQFIIPEDIACLLLRLGGKDFSGICRFGSPQLIQEGKANPVQSFRPFIGGEENWIGENLSKKEWPEFELSLDGKVFFTGKIFDRASETSEFEILFPDTKPGNHRLSVKLLNSFPVSYPYSINGLEILQSSARDFEVVSVPDFAKENNDFSILIETNKPDVDIQCTGGNGVYPLIERIHFSEKGLHVIKFHADTVSVGPAMVIADGKRQVKVFLKQVLRNNDDRIYLSTSDDIYIDKTHEQFTNYMKWYLRDGIGNAFYWRPSHQWSGVRGVDSSFYYGSLSLLKEMNMPYALLVEGRTIPGKDINPSDQVLSSPYYLGRQAHEDDGSFYYWHHFAWLGLYSDLAAKFRPYGGIFAKTRPIRVEGGPFVFYNPLATRSMDEGADAFVRNLNSARGTSTRHTGPSTLFRYFFQAGYEWLGAEQMYGPEEVVISSLRGACKAYGKDRFGTHLATQWSSGPYEAPEHATRLFLSLAISYIHGATHINTEDGLWNTEEGLDRFSKAGKEHIKQQNKIFDFIRTHKRRGRFVSPIAILQGRNDAWKCFGRDNAWGQEGEEWRFGAAEESFDLLTVFYPGSKLDAVYRFPCPREQQGWYSGTPLGPVDLLPVEAPQEVLNSYQAIAFLGWNNYKEEDFIRLLSYVKKGGTLLLAQPHLNTEVRHGSPVMIPKSEVLNELLGLDYETFLHAGSRVVGEGSVIYFPQNNYPAAPSIRPAYENELRSIGQSVVDSERKKGWVKGSDKVQFTVWDWSDGNEDYRTIYLLNIDWWSDTTKHPATLLLGEKEFDIEVRRGMIEVITVRNDCAVFPLQPGTDVFEIIQRDGTVEVRTQSTATDELIVFHRAYDRSLLLEIPDAGIHTASGSFY